jgi:signal transduction histidine kinase
MDYAFQSGLRMHMMDSNNEHNHLPLSNSLDNYGKLSYQILCLVNLSGARSEFVRKVSELLLKFTGCDEVGLVLIRDEKYYRSRVSRIPEESFTAGLDPVLNNLDDDFDDNPMNDAPLERLILDIIHGQSDTSLPFFTRNGSFWTGNCDSPFMYAINRAGMSCERRLDISRYCKSIACIPMKTSGTCVGLLTLKSAKQDFFDEARIALLEETAQTLGIIQAHRATQLALRERVKELTCLYEIARVSEQKDISLQEVLQRIVELLPPAWQYPEIASGRIILDENIYVAPGFVESYQKQVSEILAKGKPRGLVEVIYSENKPPIYEGPFLKEERTLLDAVAREVALIIERKEAEKAESELQYQLRHADRLATIGQLAAGVAHELNEPLGNILGFSQLIKKSATLPDQSENDIDKIISSTLHAREIVKKLMYFSRQMPPEKVECDLNQIVEEGVYFLGARCAKAGIDLICELSDSLPLIVADPSQLNQVLINLAVNSMQAMPQGGKLIISTRAEDDHVSLIVEDTGIGMNENVMKQIFVPFYTTKDVDEGTGLGLAVVHGIVSAHSGTIEVVSEPDKGSKFAVQLPVNQDFSITEEEQ